MIYLVSGGAGFIGSHLCQRLLNSGKVICVDNLCTGSLENISQLQNNPDFTFIKADVTCEADYSKITDLQFDYVLHLASPAGPNPQSPKSYHVLWQETYLANSYGTHLLAKFAQKNKAVFLFASSSEIYGDPQVHPQKESYHGNVNPIGPRSIYDEAKRLGEAITANFTRQLGLSTRIIRIFNTYGPKMNIDDGRALPLFINQVLAKKPITIYGDGMQTRSFCYIDDLIEGIIKILDCQEANALPVNLGNPAEITLLELLENIKKISGSLPNFKFTALPQDDPKRRRPDITLAKKLLSWQPKVSLAEGLQKTFNYYQAKIS